MLLFEIILKDLLEYSTLQIIYQKPIKFTNPDVECDYNRNIFSVV